MDASVFRNTRSDGASEPAAERERDGEGEGGRKRERDKIVKWLNAVRNTLQPVLRQSLECTVTVRVRVVTPVINHLEIDRKLLSFKGDSPPPPYPPTLPSSLARGKLSSRYNSIFTRNVSTCRKKIHLSLYFSALNLLCLHFSTI